MKFLPINLIHYSSDPIEKLEDRDYIQMMKVQKNWHKPIGLWISIEDYEDDQNWKTWCESEKFRIESLKHRHHITLKKDSKILFINSYSKLIVFSLKYKNEDVSETNKLNPLYDELNPIIYSIKWNEIYKEYDGIFICPYIWEGRLPLITSWYYGWDCSSGCIWNLDCIDKFEYIKNS